MQMVVMPSYLTPGRDLEGTTSTSTGTGTGTGTSISTTTAAATSRK